MRFPTTLGVQSARILALAVGLIAWTQGPEVMAQYGASPSQTGMFFNDLRNRVYDKDKQAGTRSGEAIYDYSRGVYIGSPDSERPMGEEAGFASNEAVRNMGEPAVRSGYAGYSARAAGDYTRYSGPYPSTSSFFAPAFSDPFLQGRRNLKLGPVNVGFGLTGMTEYNDNITRASTDQVEDLITSTFVSMDANYQLTRKNSLSLAVTMGVDHYWNHPEVAPYGGDYVLNVLPGSAISMDVKAGPVDLVIYDRVSVRPATQNDFALDATEIFGVFQNDAGLAAVWPINSDLTLALNYMRSDAIALEDQADIFDRQMNSVHGSLSWSPHHTWTLGLEGGVSWVHYPENYNNDGVLANAGAFFATALSRSTFLRVSGGYQDFSFDSPPDFSRTVTDSSIASTEAAIESTQARIDSIEESLSRTTDIATQRTLAAEQQSLVSQIDHLNSDLARQQSTKTDEDIEFNSNNRDEGDLSDYYYNVTISNQISARMSHVLSFGHESALNTTSNFITADYVNYGIGLIAWRGSRLSLSAYLEDAEESGGTLGEDLTQWGFDAYLSHQLNSRMRLGVGYHYGDTDSDLPARSYVQHAFNVDLTYLISRKLSASLGYRFWTTDADDDVNDFDQNRVIMSFNYNFGR